MVEWHCGWILLLLHMPEPLYVAANTLHNISLAIENDVFPQHHHIEQPLGNKSCSVIFNEKVSLDDPQWVLQIPETGWRCLFNILNTAARQREFAPLLVLLGDNDHIASTQLCL